MNIVFSDHCFPISNKNILGKKYLLKCVFCSRSMAQLRLIRVTGLNSGEVE